MRHPKVRTRRLLLRLWQQTGDVEYLHAAEQINLPLPELLENLPRVTGRPKERERDIPWARLTRVHGLVAAGVSVRAAARAEVAEHGWYGQHNSENAAVEYLRRMYSRHGHAARDISNMVIKAEEARAFYAGIGRKSKP